MTEWQKIGDWALKETSFLPILVCLADLDGQHLEDDLLEVWWKGSICSHATENRYGRIIQLI
ncbi:hypothetical protein PN499_25295 [Kamptonema animale CS-326]|jgi:hypothetical protein|uniref:hypothetical protein n=1 Tax=Kamptonema animale TaxID=92934 RepID=UPI00232AAC42|nr:hypothetical protein [Kamptonema animale]MDB9514522.1 hypothetical protein [Kamptonema animale CS-326]